MPTYIVTYLLIYTVTYLIIYHSLQHVNQQLSSAVERTKLLGDTYFIWKERIDFNDKISFLLFIAEQLPNSAPAPEPEQPSFIEGSIPAVDLEHFRRDLKTRRYDYH